jgi:rubrerythrin
MLSLYMKSLIVTKVQRANSVILDGQLLFLWQCTKCGRDFYGAEKQTGCDECAEKTRKRTS